MKTSNESLSEQAANEIINMITVERRFRPGDKIPNELELSQELGISRITLREAIRVLCTRGLLEIRRGKGTFVISDRDGLMTAFTAESERPEIHLRDALETRLALEPAAVYYVCRRASDEELQRLDELSAQMEQQFSDRGNRFFRQAEDFYNALAEACHNPVISAALVSANHAAYGENGFPAVADFMQTSAAGMVRACRELCGYLRARNAEGARSVDYAYVIRAFQTAGLDME